MSRITKSIETKYISGCLPMAWSRMVWCEGYVVTGNGYRVSFGGVENFLKLIVVQVAQL